ncbi:MlaD family protein [Meridianimarinicoccus aquatilis]|uniref:MCE family protein n=1 Tax=Meridianimarinicoccus aquatilis TaxID=2552766 RepID=A0A4V3BCD6_9RHOB|nr:MlaD family protein [Fluviibacterium aquatile]TDL90519.1 MCE family protein [Fluviibacterium aquatile]
MSQKTNPKLVGLFVVGAFVLAIAGLVLFGGANFLSAKRTYVLFFQGSVAGLQVGAPVNFRGVPLGQVTDISVTYFPEDTESLFLIPVYISIEPNRIRGQITGDGRTLDDLIAFGLRAELGMQSFVTGQLSVELDFKPSTAVKLTGLDPDAEEIPTLPSDTEKLKASVTRLADILQNLPLEEIATNVETAVTAATRSIIQISTSVDAISGRIGPLADDISATVADVRATVEEAKARLAMEPGEVLYSAAQSLDLLQQIAQSLESEVSTLSSGATDTIQAIQTIAQDGRALIDSLDQEITPISNDLKQALVTANRTMEDARSVINSFDTKAAPLLVEAQAALATATQMLDDARGPIASVGTLAAELTTEIGPFTDKAEETMAAAQMALDDGGLAINELRTLIATVEGGVEPIFGQADAILDNADAAMRDARNALAGARSVISPDSPTIAQLDTALREIRRAAVSLREFANFLERNPNALLTGRR